MERIFYAIAGIAGIGFFAFLLLKPVYYSFKEGGVKLVVKNILGVIAAAILIGGIISAAYFFFRIIAGPSN